MFNNIPDSWDDAVGAYEGMWDGNIRRHWLLSVIDPSKDRKTEFLRWLVTDCCVGRPYAIFSLEMYVNNINGLLSAIVESPSIRSFLAGGTFRSYKSDNLEALVDLNRRPFSVVKNDVINSSATDTEFNMQVNVEADTERMAESMDRISKFNSEMRILDSWLATIETLRNEERVILLFDDYDAFEKDIYVLYKNFFWNVMERAANILPSLCVVVGSERRLALPNGWENWGGATATWI